MTQPPPWEAANGTRQEAASAFFLSFRGFPESFRGLANLRRPANVTRGLMSALRNSPFSQSPFALPSRLAARRIAFCHFNNISRNLHLLHLPGSLLACIYENIVPLPVNGVGDQFQFFPVQFDLLRSRISKTLYGFAETFGFRHGNCLLPKHYRPSAESPPYGECLISRKPLAGPSDRDEQGFSELRKSRAESYA